MKLLILSNMGPSKAHPILGRFVYHQFQQLQQEPEFSDCEYFYLQQLSRPWQRIKYLWFFLQFCWLYILRWQKMDVIHVHFYFPTILLALFYKWFRYSKVKIIVTFHGSDIYSYQPPNRIYRWAFNYVDHSIFTSQQLYQAFNLPIKNPYSILSAGITEDFQPNPIAEKKYDLVFIGHLNQNKGITRLNQLLDHYPQPLSVLIIGQGDLNLFSHFQKSHHYISHQSHCSAAKVAVFLQQSRWLISLSYAESFGLVMTEACACGTPVLATETHGAHEQILPQSNGLLLRNDDDWLTEHLPTIVQQQLALSTEEYQQFSTQAITHSQQYRLVHVIKKLVDIYL